MKKLFAITLLIATISLIFNVLLYLDLKQFKCDSAKAVFAEREYIYPALRDLGYDPNDYAKDVLNPITVKYGFNCN